MVHLNCWFFGYVRGMFHISLHQPKPVEIGKQTHRFQPIDRDQTSFKGIWIQQQFDDCFYLCRHPLWKFEPKGIYLIRQQIENRRVLLVYLLTEGVLAHCHPVNHHSQCPKIRLQSIPLSRKCLWREIVQSSFGWGLNVKLVFFQLLQVHQVNQIQVSIPIDDKAFDFHLPPKYPLAMEVLKYIDHARREVPYQMQWQFPAMPDKTLRKSLPTDQLVQKEKMTLVTIDSISPCHQVVDHLYVDPSQHVDRLMRAILDDFTLIKHFQGEFDVTIRFYPQSRPIEAHTLLLDYLEVVQLQALGVFLKDQIGLYLLADHMVQIQEQVEFPIELILDFINRNQHHSTIPLLNQVLCLILESLEITAIQQVQLAMLINASLQ